jgi:hypothetical protein
MLDHFIRLKRASAEQARRVHTLERIDISYIYPEIDTAFGAENRDFPTSKLGGVTAEVNRVPGASFRRGRIIGAGAVNQPSPGDASGRAGCILEQEQ